MTGLLNQRVLGGLRMSLHVPGSAERLQSTDSGASSPARVPGDACCPPAISGREEQRHPLSLRR